MLKPEISFVIPLYNEQEILPLLYKRLVSLSDSSTLRIEFVLIDDGSKDNTPMLMQQIGLTDSRFHCIFLSKNFGHQRALSAGLSQALGEKAIMILDGDLQDPPELYDSFYTKIKEGYDVVYAIRKKRKEGVFKRLSYYAFYRIIKKIAYIDLPIDSGDFSMISRRAVNIMNKMPEESRYIRGMRSWIGFKQTGIEYEREERKAGVSKYSMLKLLKLAYDGIFNFSEFPIKVITNLGIITTLFAFFYLVLTIVRRIFWGDVPTGFTALLAIIVLFGGVQLISIGIIGEYIMRVFFQVKQRPLYIIKNKIVNSSVIDEMG